MDNVECIGFMCYIYIYLFYTHTLCNIYTLSRRKSQDISDRKFIPIGTLNGLFCYFTRSFLRVEKNYQKIIEKVYKSEKKYIIPNVTQNRFSKAMIYFRF